MRWRHASGWRRWFAWHPVRIGNYWVWLEMIERRYIEGLTDHWQYR